MRNLLALLALSLAIVPALRAQDVEDLPSFEAVSIREPPTPN